MDDKEKVIHSAEEFRKLRSSRNLADYEKASQYSADEKVWYEIINRYPHLKKWVVHNKTVPLSILEFLINDTDAEVRYCIAEKNKISRQMFEILSNDLDSNVRERLVGNKNLPLDILEKLASDEDDSVKFRAKLKLGKN